MVGFLTVFHFGIPSCPVEPLLEQVQGIPHPTPIRPGPQGTVTVAIQCPNILFLLRAAGCAGPKHSQASALPSVQLSQKRFTVAAGELQSGQGQAAEWVTKGVSLWGHRAKAALPGFLLQPAVRTFGELPLTLPMRSFSAFICSG